MRSLKDNKVLLAALLGALLLIPVFMLHFDPEIMRWTRDFHEGSSAYALIEVVKPVIGFISNGATLIASAFLLYLIGKYRKPGLKEFGRSLLIGLISAGVMTQILKHLIGRARPRLTYDLVFIGPSLKSGYDSFPSGHTAVVFSLAYVVSQYYPRQSLTFYLFAFIVGLYRIDGLSHFPSDVLGGAVVGILIANLVLSRTANSPVLAECSK
jgi:membrane-associated phospholipid phosphatase